MRDPRIETLGHDSLAVSQERTENGTRVTRGTLQNESQSLELQGHTFEAVIPEPYHLPECHYTVDTGNIQYGWNDCICDALRACEQRVLGLRIDNLNVKSFNAGLDAAEAALETWVSYTFPAHRPGWTGKIIAAIRALKDNL